MKKISFYLVLIPMTFCLLGSDACQRDYEFAPDANLASPSPTASSSASPTASASPSASASSSGSPTASASSSPNASASGSPTASASPVDEEVVGKSFLKELKEQAPTINNTTPVGNWLGKLYEEEEAVSGTPVDSDQDGYSDLLERDSGTNPNDKTSFPTNFKTILAKRFINFDSDYDGIPDSEELERGSDSTLPDTDKDGFNDGAELLSKTNLLDSKSKPGDIDGDGLSTDFENIQGTNPRNSDTDGDSLRDDTEFAIGCDPRKTDSDYDGILDGKEIEIGSDPTIPESN